MINAMPYLAVFGGIGITAYTITKIIQRANNTIDYVNKEVYSDYNDEYYPSRSMRKKQ